MVSCSTPGCTNCSLVKKNLSWHKVPTQDQSLRKQWLAKISLAGNLPKDENFIICSEHFDPCCFERNLMSEFGLARKKAKLKQDAVPTIFAHRRLPQKRSTSENRQDKRKRMVLVAEAMAGEEEAWINTPLAAEERIVIRFCDVDVAIQTESPLMVDKEIDHAKRTKSKGTQCITSKFLSKKVQTIETPSANVSTLTDISLEDISKYDLDETKNVAPDLDSTIHSDCYLSTGEEIKDDFDNSYIPEDNSDTEISQDESDLDDEFKIQQQNCPMKETKFIVFWTSIVSLLKFCLICGKPAVIKTIKSVGSLLRVKLLCCSLHESEWNSQPFVRGIAAGNICLAAGILFSGTTFQRTSEMLSIANVKSIGKTCFNEIQKRLLLPAINKIYLKYQELILVRLVALGDVDLSGDDRCDSPGHCAKYDTYSMMDPMTNEVVAFHVCQSTSAGNSNRMEKYGMIKVIDELEVSGVQIRSLTTDHHTQIRKYLRIERKDIVHQFDIWHVSKSIKKKLTKAAKKKPCQELNKWIKSIINHFWWCCATCGKDPILLQEKWLSILDHVQNRHSWRGNQKYKKCCHRKYTKQESLRKKWLTDGSPPFLALEKVVRANWLLKDFKCLSEFRHTGNLEVYHALYNKFSPKRLHFQLPVMIARTQLAVLDHNSGAESGHACTKEGVPRYKVSYTKITKEWVAKKIHEPKSKEYLDDLLEEVIRMQSTGDIGEGPTIPRDIPRNIAPVENPGKWVVIDRMRTRFEPPDGTKS